MISTAHHIFALNFIKIGLARQKRDGRQAYLGVRTIFGHPLGQVFAAVKHTFLTVNATYFYSFQIVGGRDYDYFKHNVVAVNHHAGVEFFNFLIFNLSKVNVHFVNVKIAVGARFNFVPSAVVHPINLCVAHQHTGHVQHKSVV
uniref:16 kDa protein n=1 Tax=Autographa californica nuclear polyhedrosis virus TaxID=46015 RepID=Q64804_NPVAC|nr:16 kDa protein [Autographa californica nucleopolyhedrovirus]